MQVSVKARLLEYVEASNIVSEKGVIVVTLVDSGKTFRIRAKDIHFIAVANKRYRISYYRYVKAQSSLSAITKKEITLAGLPFVKVVLKNPDGSKGETMYYPAAAVED